MGQGHIYITGIYIYIFGAKMWNGGMQSANLSAVEYCGRKNQGIFY